MLTCDVTWQMKCLIKIKPRDATRKGLLKQLTHRGGRQRPYLSGTLARSASRRTTAPTKRSERDFRRGM